MSATTITTKKEKNEEQFELEQQFVLRMPAGEYATRLRDLIESGDEKIRERLFIDLNPETRRGRIKFDDTIFKATLYDLPCITESYKTFDRKTLYKIADVAQILVCRLPGDLSSSDDDDEEDETNKRTNTNATTMSDGGNEKKKEGKR
jgi:TATA-binding protein-associated factor Taf7